jgi:hypothetical protein
VEAVVDLSNERTVGVNVPGVSMIVYLPREILTKVKPPPPPEPPVGTIVQAMYDDSEDVFQRLFSRQEGWRAIINGGGYTWAELCAEAIPVVLVPEPTAPEPVELPMTLTTRSMKTRRIRVDRRGSTVGLEISIDTTQPAIYRAALSPLDATLVARALDTAVAEIERSTL